jgi:NADH:ubiquinone oxidoreductase subunit 6 (subunit J)
MTLHKILKIVALLLGVAGVIFLAMIIAKGDEAVSATGEGVDGFLYVAYIIFAITLIFVLFFVIKGVFAGNIKNTLISVGAFLAIVLISYVMADGNPMTMSEGEMLSASGSKWVGTGLYTFYILAIIAIGSMVFSGIKKITK